MDHSIFRDMPLFVAVAERRSFAKAAGALNIPASTLSRRIAALEAGIGLRLLNRTTRRVELTEDGHAYFNRAERIVADARMAHEDLRIDANLPRGLLRVSMPLALADAVAANWLVEFSARYPDVTIQIDTAPTRVDLIAENFDVCFRAGRQPSSTLTIRRMASYAISLFAAPSYLAQHGEPAHPSELVNHQCVPFFNFQTGNLWRLSRGGETIGVRVTGRLGVDDPFVSKRIAVSGAGIAGTIDIIAEENLRAGTLVRVLPEWNLAAVPLYAITATKRQPARTRALLDFIAEKLSGHADNGPAVFGLSAYGRASGGGAEAS